MQSRRIFKDWAPRWATHTIIKTAIQIVSPVHLKSDTEDVVRPDSQLPVRDQKHCCSVAGRFLALDRFVHHMTVVERYSDLECSTFLGCSPKDVRLSRDRALQRLGDNESLSQMVTEFDPVMAKAFISSVVAAQIQ